jgi:hypothetical protein
MGRFLNLVKQTSEPTPNIIKLLESTTIGTNGTLYRLLDTKVKVHLLANPTFIYLERHGVVIANITLCERRVNILGTHTLTHYIRYFAFSKSFQGSGSTTGSNSSLTAYLLKFFTAQDKASKSLFWAYIDPQNIRSLNMNNRFGFSTIGTFQTIAFSRFYPTKKENVTLLQKNEEQIVLKELKASYKNHLFYQEDQLFKDNMYYILKVNGAIVAGIHARPVHWKIEALPGFFGKFILKYVHKLPLLSRIINPQNYRFLCTEGFFCKAGFEGRLSELFEGVLEKTGHNSLLIWKDNNDLSLKELKIKWGLLQKIKANNPINIVAKFQNYSQEEIAAITMKKKYIRGFDVT